MGASDDGRDGDDGGEGVRQAESELAHFLLPALVHELRQPLLGLKAGVQLLARALGEPLTGRDEYAMLVEQLARMEELLRSHQELLAPTHARPQPFVARPVIERAVRLLGHKLRPIGPRFQALLDGSAPPVMGQPSALAFAVINLLSNACDALDGAASVTGRVAVRLVETAAGVEVRVSDEGTGIDQAHRERIFDAHFTTRRERGGMGLGLAIARQVMRGAGGEVRLVPLDDGLRLPWARTELAAVLPIARRAGEETR